MRIISDIFRLHIGAYAPKFNSISISGYHMQEAGRDGGSRTRLYAGRWRRICPCRPAPRGSTVDKFAPQPLLLLGHRYELPLWRVAKMRAARLLWAKLMQALRADRTIRVRSVCAPIARPVRLEPDGAGCFQQCDAHLHRGAWRRHKVIHSPCIPMPWMKRLALPDGFFRAHCPQHATLHPAGDRHVPGHRPLGRQLLRRAAHL